MSDAITLRVELGGERSIADPPKAGQVSPIAARETDPALVLSLESGVVDLSLGSTTQRLDRASFALIPRGTSYALRAKSPTARALVLVVHERARRDAIEEYRPHVDAKRFDEIVATPRLFTRTRWVDEIAHRYLFEIDGCGRHASAAARFLETEIAKELYFLGVEQLEAKQRASLLHEGSDVVKNARAWIEEHLFSPLKLEELAKRCHTSESTLLRAFRRELGVAPATFHRDRRLDEALLLLESGRYGVSEVASRVGYANLPAFTVAFRRRFGVVPSRARPVARPTLPPQGEPSRKRTSL